MGVSYGGFIATTLAYKYPEVYDRLVLVDPFLNLLAYAQSAKYFTTMMGLNFTALGQALPDDDLLELSNKYDIDQTAMLKIRKTNSDHCRSPISNMDSIKAATLLLLSEDDERKCLH